MIEHCWPFPEYDAIQRDFPDLEVEPQCYARAKTIYVEIAHQEAQAIQGLLLLNSQLAEQDYYDRLIRQSFDLAQCQRSEGGLFQRANTRLVLQIKGYIKGCTKLSGHRSSE